MKPWGQVPWLDLERAMGSGSLDLFVGTWAKSASEPVPMALLCPHGLILSSFIGSFFSETNYRQRGFFKILNHHQNLHILETPTKLVNQVHQLTRWHLSKTSQWTCPHGFFSQFYAVDVSFPTRALHLKWALIPSHIL